MAAKTTAFTHTVVFTPSAALPTISKSTKKESTVTKTAAPKKSTVRKSTKKSPLAHLPLGVKVNVKVAGERTMRKSVILTAHTDRDNIVLVKTGGRGRPSHLPVEKIEKTRVL